MPAPQAAVAWASFALMAGVCGTVLAMGAGRVAPPSETRPLGGFMKLLACRSPSGAGSARVTGAAITALAVRVAKLRLEIYLAVSSLAHVCTKICIRV